jgi:hypothetical protein
LGLLASLLIANVSAKQLVVIFFFSIKMFRSIIISFLLLSHYTEAFPRTETDLSIWPDLAKRATPPSGTLQVSGVSVDTGAAAQEVGSEGSGCRQGTVGTAVSADQTIVALLFSNFTAAVGPNVKHQKRAFCRVNVTYTSPGWVFNVQSIDFRGYYRMDKGVNASITTKFQYSSTKGSVRQFFVCRC